MHKNTNPTSWEVDFGLPELLLMHKNTNPTSWEVYFGLPELLLMHKNTNPTSWEVYKFTFSLQSIRPLTQQVGKWFFIIS